MRERAPSPSTAKAPAASGAFAFRTSCREFLQSAIKLKLSGFYGVGGKRIGPPQKTRRFCFFARFKGTKQQQFRHSAVQHSDARDFGQRSGL
jgi:hypothetical protein